MQSGALLDTRTPEEKAQRDVHISELVASAMVPQWTEKTLAQCRKFPIFDQDGSGSCVAQTRAKELGILRFLKDGRYVHFSAAHIYQRRTNKPDAGMGITDVRRIAAEGTTLEVLAPSQGMSDAQMDAVVVEPYQQEVGKIFAVPDAVTLPAGDVDMIASTIQATRKGVMVWFYFRLDEWGDSPVIKDAALDLYAPSTLRHSVCAVDFALIGGKKHIIIEDSWGPGAAVGGQRAIPVEFFSKRNYLADYLMTFKFDQQAVKPHFNFTRDLELGMSHADVAALQDCLKYEGNFPTNVTGSTYFGPVTKKAVQAFQVKHGIISSGLSFGRVGPRTRAKLNEIYGV